MILIVLLALFFLALPVASIFYGVDSRYQARSKEQELASLGMEWSEQQVTQEVRPTTAERTSAIGLRMLMRHVPNRAGRL